MPTDIDEIFQRADLCDQDLRTELIFVCRVGCLASRFLRFGGFVTLALSGGLGIFAIVRRLVWGGAWMSPVTLLSVTLFPLALQFFLLGFIAEVVVRTYYESQGKPIYAVRAPARPPKTV